MNLPRIVAFTGHARHGKDICAEHLVGRYGYVRHALADPLKDAACIMFGWSRDDLDGPSKDITDPRWGLSPRLALQILGTEYAQRDLCAASPRFAEITGRKLWVRRLLDSCASEPLVVISDCRFPHEAEEIRMAGGVVLKVVRDWPVDLTHESERSVDEIVADGVLDNHGSIEDLHLLLDATMDIIAGGQP